MIVLPGRPLHNETQRHVARMSVRNDDHIGDLDLLIRELIDQDLWDKLTVLCVAGPDSTDSLLDLKGHQDSALIGSPAFAADAGFTTVGTTDLVDTQFAYDGSYASDASCGCYIQNPHPHTSGYEYLMGCTHDTTPPGADWYTGLSVLSASTFIGTVQAGTGLGVLMSGVSNAAFRATSRTSAFSVTAMTKTASATGSSSASGIQATMPFTTMIIGATNRNTGGIAFPNPNEYSAWFMGRGLSVLELEALRASLQSYFTRRGTAV